MNSLEELISLDEEGKTFFKCKQKTFILIFTFSLENGKILVELGLKYERKMCVKWQLYIRHSFAELHRV
jgi:hypothetical protein